MFSFATNPTSIYVKFNGSDWRTKKYVKVNGQTKNEEMLLFGGQETVSGTVEIVLPPGRNVDHLGIKIEMIGQIGRVHWILWDISRHNVIAHCWGHSRTMSDLGPYITLWCGILPSILLVLPILLPWSIITDITDLHFERGNNVRFLSVVRELESVGQLDKGKTYPFEFTSEKPFETYSGINVRLRYFVRVTITRAYNNNYVKEQDFSVENAQPASTVMTEIK